jgi:hypothetical protein
MRPSEKAFIKREIRRNTISKAGSMTFEEFKAIKNRVKAELNRDQEDFILLRENE